ncbi:MAG: hypothetical protein Q7T70_10645 [Polaromonas sp.]|nr:hypothetical protein [Polaromonas sp.]
MPLAASSPSGQTGVSADKRRSRLPLISVPMVLSAVLAALVAFMVLMPEGVAESAQALAAWGVIGLIAVFAVLAIAKGLERLLECEAD